jgi:hypothetical protein
MSQPKDLADRTLGRIVERLRLVETKGSDGPLLPLTSAMGPVGAMRVFRPEAGGRVQKVVAVDLVVPPIGLDSHMIFAFTSARSPVPHFTLDAVQAPGAPAQGGGYLAFHLDLIPRADLGAYLGHLNAVFDPLTATFAEASAIEGLAAAAIGPRQRALMSPWMLANRASEAAFAAIGPVVDRYLDHWFSLVDGGVPEGGLDGLEGYGWEERDRRNRAAIFDPAVDPVWAQVSRLVGEPTSLRIRDELKAIG